MSDNETLMKNLFTALESTIAGGDQLRTSQIIAFANPGVYLGTQLDESVPTDLYKQSSAVNLLLAPSFIGQSIIGSLSSKFFSIVDDAVVPIKQLTPGEQEELDNMTALMDSLSDDYFAKRAAYVHALSRYQQVQRTDPNSPDLPDLDVAVDAAMAAWRKNNLRQKYENASGIVASYWRGNGIMHLFDELRDVEDKAKIMTGLGAFYPARLLPPVSAWAKDDGWQAVHFHVDDQTSSSSSSSTHWGGGFGVSWGFWGVGGGIDVQHNEGRSATSATQLDVSFDYMQVTVLRPWFDDYEFILGSNNWGWEPTTHGGKNPEALSIGRDLNAKPPVPPDLQRSTMPLIVKSVIVARNIVIQGDFSQSDYQYISDHRSEHGGFGIGPFSFNSSFESASGSQSQHSTAGNGSLVIPDPHIIAYVCDVLGDAPHPDLSLPWPQGHAPYVPHLDSAAMELRDSAERLRLRHELALIGLQEQADATHARLKLAQKHRPSADLLTLEVAQAGAITAQRAAPRQTAMAGMTGVTGNGHST